MARQMYVCRVVPVFWNTITREQIMILLGEENEGVHRKYIIAPALADRPPKMTLDDQPMSDGYAFARWVTCRRWCADAWNRRQAAAFAAGERVLAMLVEERDARDAARLGAPIWPREPFYPIRWRRVSDDRLEVAWLDDRGQLRISAIAVHRDATGQTLDVAGGDGTAGVDAQVLAHLGYDLALSRIHGRGAWEDEGPHL